MTTPTPPGWYPDPHGRPVTVYWDGVQWIGVQPPPAPRDRTTEIWVGVGAMGLLAAFALAYSLIEHVF